MHAVRNIKRFPGLVALVRFVHRAIAIGRRIRSHTGAGRDLPSAVLDLPGIRNHFVGYYDHSPFKTDDERLLLIHSTTHPAWRRPSARVPVRIELIDHEQGKVVRELGQSNAWNWQQGARALWLDSDTVVFNIYDAIQDRYRARMVSCDGTHQGDLPLPVQEVDSRGRIYGLSYEALAAVRPDYGYRNRPPGSKDMSDNAIEQFDPSTSTHRVLVNLPTLKEETEARHDRPITHAKFNHVMVSPNAGRLVFLLRYFVDGHRVTDLYEMPTEGGWPRLLMADSGVSHVCWWGDDALVATMTGAQGFGYYSLPITEPGGKLFWAQPDGHTSRLDEEHMLTDTYPDGHALRHLLIRNLPTGQLTEVGVFAEPILFQGETRCDLHPSASPSGRYIQVDCAVGHRRAIAVVANPLFDELRT